MQLKAQLHLLKNKKSLRVLKPTISTFTTKVNQNFDHSICELNTESIKEHDAEGAGGLDIFDALDKSGY
jgi:hypothetical protein